jgi:hypothetical protein
VLATAAGTFLRDTMGDVVRALGTTVNLTSAHVAFKATAAGPAVVVELGAAEANALCKAYWRHALGAVAGIPVAEIARIEKRALEPFSDGDHKDEAGASLDDLFLEYGAGANATFVDIVSS